MTDAPLCSPCSWKDLGPTPQPCRVTQKYGKLMGDARGMCQVTSEAHRIKANRVHRAGA